MNNKQQHADIQYDAVVAGHICIDIIPGIPGNRTGSFAELILPGGVLDVGSVIFSPGGPVSNTGLAMSKLGLHVQLMGKIGNDLMGGVLSSLLKPYGVADKMIVEEGENTSYTIVLAPPEIDRSFLHHSGANNTFNAEDIDYESVATSRIFHLGYPPLMRKLFRDEGQGLTEIFKKVKQLGVTTSMDMSLPDPHSESGKSNWKRILSNVLPYVDIFLPSIEEATFMLDRELYDRRKAEAKGRDPVLAYQGEDYTYLSSMIVDYGVRITALKSGVRGFYVRTGNKSAVQEIGRACPANIDEWHDRELWSPSYLAEVFGSATGSGDSSIAGFIAAYLRGYSLEDTVQIANTLGWENVRGQDALSTIEDWQTSLRLLSDKDRKRNPLNLDNGKWRCSESENLYYDRWTGLNQCL